MVENGIRRGRYSTDDLEAGISHAAWSERGWPSIAALFKSTPIGPFSTTADDFAIGEIALSYTTGTARVLERTPERIAADGIDILGVGALLEGTMAGLAANREFHLGSGEMLLFDLSQPITMTMSDSRSIQIAIPRALAEANLGPVQELHGAIVTSTATAAFQEHLLALLQTLDTASDADASRLRAALIEALARALR